LSNPPFSLVWSLIIFFILLSISGFFYVISYRGFKIQNLYSGFSTLSSAILVTSFTVYEIIYQIFPWPYGPYFVIVAIIVVLLHCTVWMIKKRKQDKNYSILSEEEISIKPQLSLKEEYLRKSFHLAGVLVPIGYYWIFPWANNIIYAIITSPQGILLYERLWGSFSFYPYSIDDPTAPGELIHFILWCSLIFMLIPEFIRIFSRSEYTMFHRLIKSVLRAKEYISIGPQVLLVLGAIGSFFLAQIGLYSYEIAVSSTFTACVADGLVAVLGRRFGKHRMKILNGEEKSIEGFVIGFVSAYICSMIILGPLYAIFAAIIFLLLDVFSTYISDNLLNPILLSIVVWIAYIMIQFPLGWDF